mgnify:FL=1
MPDTEDDPTIRYRVTRAEAAIHDLNESAEAVPLMRQQMEALVKQVESLAEQGARVTVALYSLAGGVILAAIVFAATIASAK